MEWRITTDDTGYTVQQFLREKHAFSRRLLRSVKDEGGSIDVNGEVHDLRYILREGDVVNVSFPPEKVAPHLQADTVPLTIVYEDEDLLIVDKQAGLATIPSRNHPVYTLANGLLAYYQKHDIHSTIHVVTRLDKDTSGLVLIAKHRYCHALFARMQQSHEIRRKYIAIVKGEPIEKIATIDAPIGRKEGSIIERAVSSDGQKAVTHYRILNTTPDGNHTFVEIELQTGRTHQIRVHMDYIGHPLIGDDLYSEKDDRIGRQALHCHELTFKHPLAQKELSLKAPIPADMKALY